MKVLYEEELATHLGPESWVAPRKGRGQALTGEVRAVLLSREIDTLGCRRCRPTRKATSLVSLSQDAMRTRRGLRTKHASKLLTRESGDPALDHDGIVVRGVNPKGVRRR